MSASKIPSFNFLKGGEDITAPRDGTAFEWDKAAIRVREHLGDALNAKNLSFLFGSGCSSLSVAGKQVGIPTMAPLAQTFISDLTGDAEFPTEEEFAQVKEHLGIDLEAAQFEKNLERVMEVLYGASFIGSVSESAAFSKGKPAIDSITKKVTAYIQKVCTTGAFSAGDSTVIDLYQAFYRKLLFRDRNLPRPWVFTTNYDLFNETAMDRLAIPYCNGFSGTAERRFNPATYRYSLAEQLDLSNRKWTAVDSYIYLCKLHGSVNWVEEDGTLFPIREFSSMAGMSSGRVMIYPTPMKQSASFGSPYSDLFREFQSRIVREQSVLVVMGYSFSDQHVNNIIFQALTVPTFRMIAFLSPSTSGVTKTLRDLKDPRIWLIGGDGPDKDSKAHHFKTVIDRFFPVSPGDKVDTAIQKVIESLIAKGAGAPTAP